MTKIQLIQFPHQLSEAACDSARRTLVVNPVSYLPCPDMVSDMMKKAAMVWALGPNPQDIGIETFAGDTLMRYPPIKTGLEAE